MVQILTEGTEKNIRKLTLSDVTAKKTQTFNASQVIKENQVGKKIIYGQ